MCIYRYIEVSFCKTIANYTKDDTTAKHDWYTQSVLISPKILPIIYNQNISIYSPYISFHI
jgi:hypothetical protein